VDIAVPNTKDSVIIAASVASAHPTWTVRVVYAMLTAMPMELVSVTLTGVMKTVVSTPDNVIQNVKADVSDQPTPIVKSVSVTLTEMKTTSVNVTQTGLDQTVANIWDTVMTHVTDVMDPQPMTPTPRMLVSVTSVLTTLIVMLAETAHVIATGAQPLTAISIVEHAGRTAPNQLEIVTHVDAMAQLSTTVSNVSSTPTDPSMDTVLVTRTGAILMMEQPVEITPAIVTTDALQDVTDLATMPVKPVLNTHHSLMVHVYVINIGTVNSVNTIVENVILAVTDVLDQLTLTVPVV
jgi:hypothetical protein